MRHKPCDFLGRHVSLAVHPLTVNFILVHVNSVHIIQHKTNKTAFPNLKTILKRLYFDETFHHQETGSASRSKNSSSYLSSFLFDWDGHDSGYAEKYWRYINEKKNFDVLLFVERTIRHPRQRRHQWCHLRELSHSGHTPGRSLLILEGHREQLMQALLQTRDDYQAASPIGIMPRIGIMRHRQFSPTWGRNMKFRPI